MDTNFSDTDSFDKLRTGNTGLTQPPRGRKSIKNPRCEIRGKSENPVVAQAIPSTSLGTGLAIFTIDKNAKK